MRFPIRKNSLSRCRLITLAFVAVDLKVVISKLSSKLLVKDVWKFCFKNSEEMAQMAGPDPIWTTCPNCHTEIITTTQRSISTFQIVFAGGLCLFSFFAGWIPFFIDEWNDVLHTCPNCNYAIGRYKILYTYLSI